MFLTDEAYSREVKALASAATPVDMAIAFWGRGAQDLIAASQCGRRRIICNLVSGGTNPMVIRALLSAADIDVRQDESLHAKVILGTGHGIVGSANFSANGLGFESDDRGSWIEAGYLLRDHTHLTEARRWFEKLWKSAQEITEDMLVAAEENWRRNRARRPKPRGDQFIIHPDTWRDYLHRGIQIIIWRRRPSTEENARATHDRARRNRDLTESSGRGEGRRLALDYYHGWPQGDLSNLEATYIDVHYQQNGNTVCYGARRPLANGHTSWGAKDGGGSMDAMEKVRTIADQRFGEEDRRAFAQWIQPLLQEHFEGWASAQGEEPDTGGLVLRLDKALEAAFVTNDERFQWLLQCCELISEGLGLRSVKVDTLVPQARIGAYSGFRRHLFRLSHKLRCGVCYMAGPIN